MGGTAEIPDPEPPCDGMYDVIVVGAEPEGVAAAVSASRNGLTVLLLEDDQDPGGLMTLGKLNFIDMNITPDQVLLTQGIFKEFHDRVGGTAFDVDKAIGVFRDMLESRRSIVSVYNAVDIMPVMDGKELLGVSYRKDGAAEKAFGKVIIDATVDADLAFLAGVPYTFAGEDIGEADRMMGVTLVFELSGIDWEKIETYLNNDESEHTGAIGKTAWGYNEEGYSYQPRDEFMRMRGLNIARQDDGNILINALIIFGVDVLDPDSRREGVERAQKELEYIVPYLRENMTGFENAELAGTAEKLYVRESRHIIGEYQLELHDVLENKDKWDRIAFGNYPVDVQPTISQRWGTVVGNPVQYAVPYRSIVPLEVENILVVGRSASYKSLAAGSARVIPVGMCEGEAAGVAAAVAVREGITPREIIYAENGEELVGEIQERLVAQGAYLEPFREGAEIENHWAYEGVRTIRGLGLLDGGYGNNYHLEEEMGKWRFQNLINRVVEKAGFIEKASYEVDTEPVNADIIPIVYEISARSKGEYREDISYTDAISYLQVQGLLSIDGVGNNYFQVREEPCNGDIIPVFYQISSSYAGEYAADRTYTDILEYLEEKGLLNHSLADYFEDPERRPKAAEVTVLAANIYHYLMK